MNKDKYTKNKVNTRKIRYLNTMNKNNTRRNFIKQNLILLFSFSFLKLNFIASNLKSIVLKKKKNFIWHLNEND